MVFSKQKKEEYRAVSPYWCSTFLLVEGEKKNRAWWENFFKFTEKQLNKGKGEIVASMIKSGKATIKEFDSIIFSNGYSKTRDQFTIGVKGISIGTGNPEWGAEEGVLYFVIRLK